MVSDIRVTYRRRHSYNTASNRIEVVKTPGRNYRVLFMCLGARLTVHYMKKSVGAVKCACCKKPLAGVCVVVFVR